MEIALRRVKQQDYRKIFEWRNEPEIRLQMFNSKVLSWDEHEKFWDNIINSSNKHGFIINANGEDSGVIRFDVEGEKAEVDIFISKKFQGKGVGSKALKQGIEIAEKMNFKLITARVKFTNEASKKIFEKNGFTPKYTYYELNL